MVCDASEDANVSYVSDDVCDASSDSQPPQRAASVVFSFCFTQE